MRIVLLKGQSQYGSLRLHIDQLAAAFAAMGHEAIVVDLAAPDGVARLNAALARPVQFFYALNSMGVDLRVGDRSLYDVADALFMTLHVDHPVHLWSRLETKMDRRFVVSFLDETHVKLARDCFPPDHFAALSLMPPGANTSIPPVMPDERQLFQRWEADRDIPLLFTGTYRGMPQRGWRGAERNFVTTLFDDAADLALSQDTLALEDAIDQVLATRDTCLPPASRTQLIQKSREVYQYVEAYRRHQLLVTLNRAGVPLVVYGKGWEDRPFPAFDWRGEGSFEQTLGLLRRTRLVLNSNNNFVAGGHERVFAAQINGAAVLSDTSRYYDRHYADGRDMLFYRWTALDTLPARVEAALAGPAGLAAIARAGFHQAATHHTWDARARHIIDLFAAVNILTR
ncbi:glycosyltransferase family protein [Nitrospirillum pindoramense]|uniref:Glycosyl transferase family 1 n=1 Tax=Nitrospirillum amazonense TaxID=28077 RepID=A0A560GX18_9PROT|nr:glycosyltransferase [Nitrospirillum amazonense]TWB38548.1 glycosyl transferase family 1 [Nitrospirillum amazonense]